MIEHLGWLLLFYEEQPKCKRRICLENKQQSLFNKTEYNSGREIK